MKSWILAIGLLSVASTGCVVSSAADTYEFCADNSDCLSSDTCTRVITTVSDGQMCTHGCLDHSDCEGGPAGLGGSCYMIFGDPDPLNFVCYMRCFDNFDCPVGSSCLTATMGGVPTDAVCFPD